MKPRPNESFDDFLDRFFGRSQPIVDEAEARRRFVSNSERRRAAQREAKRRWKKKRAWLRWKQWRQDKCDE